MKNVLEDIPGNSYEFTQPIQMRFNELISGVRSDLAIKIFGDNIDELMNIAEQIKAMLAKTPGASDIKIEQATGLPVLSIIPDKAAMESYGLNIADVQDVIRVAMGGKNVGQLFEGDKRFNIVVRLPEPLRIDVETLEELPIPLGSKISAKSKQPNYVPLKEIAKLSVSYGPNQISRENGKRRVVVTANVRDRDLGGFVDNLKQNNYVNKLKLASWNMD